MSQGNEFIEFPKMPRLTRDAIITEKIDGTNAQILITENGDIFTGSRSRWITVADDNFGFAKWVEGNKDQVLKLGPGRHFGEWWGSGIQRGYNLPKGEKRFSLFNTIRWSDDSVRPEGFHCVPLLWQGTFSTQAADIVLNTLRQNGSVASPGFMRPEGIVIFHIAGNFGFKKTIEKDEVPKTML